MKLPLKWLKEFIAVSGSPQSVADRLTLSGTAIEGLEDLNGSVVLNAEITTNRPDCLSIRGLAKEWSAVTGNKLNALKDPKIAKVSKTSLPLTIQIEDKKGCPFYTARTFEEVQVLPADQYVLDRISWMGQAGVNNVADITNLCLFEIGQPLHAFDYDKIEGSKIIVRRSRKGESIIGINNVKYDLDESILIIADASKPIAIAGVMGGKGTEITSSTKRVALESACFDPMLVRQASRKLKISTDSSYRFERTINPAKVIQGSNRATSLILKDAHAKIGSNLILAGKEPKILKKEKPATIKIEDINRTLGHDFTVPKVLKILKNLGLNVKEMNKGTICVEPSLERRDIKIGADIVEEVVRISGFESIQTRIPITRHKLKEVDASMSYANLHEIKRSLVSQGFWEAVTFSLVSKQSLVNARTKDVGNCLRIKNPLSQEQEILRPNGLVGMLNALSHNINRKEKNLQFFEIAKRFNEGKEETILSLGLTGLFSEAWSGQRQSSIYDLKGVVENVFKLTQRDVPEWKVLESTDSFLSGISLCGKRGNIAECHEVEPLVLNQWDILYPVFYAEVVLESLFDLSQSHQEYAELPKFPAVRRDVAFVIDNKYSVKDIEKAIFSSNSKLITQVVLFDQFTGKSVPKGKRSLAFSLQYQKTEGTFTEEEINSLHEKVVGSLQSEFSIELR